jgi:predicted ATPase/DNA-binding CsgD family transcriptional regulator
MRPAGQERLADPARLASPAGLAAAGVTARELEILDAIGHRLANPEIAARLHISVRTVESHVSALLRKTGLASRPQLVELAQQLPAGPTIPIPTTSLVGRDAELATLSGLLASSELVTLTGPAGAGKSRLALAAVQAWPGETRLVDLTSATADEATALIAAGLGIGYEASDLATAARVTLAGRSLLLVADNCEHVLAAAGAVLEPLVSAVTGLRVLATSREPLGVGGERLFPVKPLGLPTGPSPAEVQASAAGRLFLDRAQAAAPGFRLDEASAPHVAGICAQLDGLPLAIELAAARVRTLDVRGLASSLQNRLGVLERPGRAGRHESLASAIEWSWRLLSDAERGLLRRLAALPGEFTLPLAEVAGTALAGGAASPDSPAAGPDSPTTRPAGPDSPTARPAGPDSPTTRPAGRAAGSGGPDGAGVRPLLLRLVEQSLVSVRLPAGEPARYRLLSVIRAFALEHAAPVADEQVLRAHARFIATAAATAAQSRWQAAPPASAAPGPDEPNLLAALAWAAGHDSELAGQLLISASQLVETEPSRHALQTISDLARQRPPDWSSEALSRASQTVCYLSLEQGGQLADLSRQAAVTSRDRAFAGLASGWVRAYRHDTRAARQQLDPVLSYARQAGEPWLEASALQARGLASITAASAFADWELAASRFVAAGDLVHAHNVRYMLAHRAVEDRIRLDDVPVWLDGCESFAASHRLTHELAHVRLTRAGYLLIRDHPAAARELLEAALPVFRQAGDFRCVARTLTELAQPTLAADPAAQCEFLLGALGAAAIASGPPLQAQILIGLTGAAGAAGDLVLAARCLGALESIAGQATGGTGRGSRAPAAAVEPGLQQALGRPAYATFVSEGREGGIGLITALYPR